MALRYPRLYLRTAMHIAAALATFILLGAISLALIATWELRDYVETRDSSLAKEAANVLNAGGEAALVEWLQTVAPVKPDVSIYVLDQNSRDILDRELPTQYAEFVRESVIGEPEQAESNYRPIKLAPQIIGPDGAVYSFLVIPKGISIWGSTATALGLLIVAAIVIAGVAWLIARTVGRPIGELQFAVRELASGDTSARVPTVISKRKDELGALAADFNIMADRLKQLIEGRESLFREMSHELRSPLARLQAAIALARERGEPDEAMQQRIEQEIKRMNDVIGEMLRYSGLGTTIEPRKRLLRIDRRLRELIEVEEIEAANQNCRLALHTEKDLAVVGDPGLLVSGFENIIRNAIRFAPADSTVDVSARRNPDTLGQIVVTVSDRGPGVAAEHLEEIFEPYFRIASAYNDQQSTGLGLAIVKRVFERHNGTVRASQRDGGGLEITVTLPAAEMN
jgi:two-component system sensor histidine kinase CpxA